MTFEHFIERLFSRTHPVWGTALALGILASLYVVPDQLSKATTREINFQRHLSHSVEQSAQAQERLASLETLKSMDVEQLKAGMSGHALSQKSLFESGLSLQEERRLLEKQLDIMTTTLLINPALQRVFLMHADQPVSGSLISYIPLRSFGGAPMTLPPSVRIISKERFAHPERGKSEEVNGVLQWIPPQVGTSVRARALGEFVVFTNSALILHGPPLSPEDHERFPHVCLGLDRDAARKVYRATYIGTKINLSHIAIEPQISETPLLSGTTFAR